MNLKKLLPFVLALNCTPANTHNPRPEIRNNIQQSLYIDVPPNQANFTAIQTLTNEGVYSVPADRRFHPDAEALRGNVVRILMETAGHRPVAEVTRDPFPDVVRTHPLAGHLARAIELGVIRGYDDRLFRVNRAASNVEALKMIVLSQGLTVAELPTCSSYTDVAPDVWYAPFGCYARRHNLIDATADGRMDRDRQLTMATFSEMLHRFFVANPNRLPRNRRLAQD